MHTPILVVCVLWWGVLLHNPHSGGVCFYSGWGVFMHTLILVLCVSMVWSTCAYAHSGGVCASMVGGTPAYLHFGGVCFYGGDYSCVFPFEWYAFLLWVVLV